MDCRLPTCPPSKGPVCHRPPTEDLQLGAQCTGNNNADPFTRWSDTYVDICGIRYVCCFVVLTVSFKTSYVKLTKGVNIIDIFFLYVKMLNFMPKRERSREVLVHCFILKKSAAKRYPVLWEAYGEHAPSQDRCERRFTHALKEMIST